MVLFTIVCMPFWNATTDAYSRGDIEWIRRASRKMNLMMLLIFAGLILMLLLSDFVYKIWMKGVEVPISLSIGMAAYQMILILRYMGMVGLKHTTDSIGALTNF